MLLAFHNFHLTSWEQVSTAHRHWIRENRCVLAIGQMKVLELKKEVADLLALTLGQDTRTPGSWGLFALSLRCLSFALPLKLTEYSHSFHEGSPFPLSCQLLVTLQNPALCQHSLRLYQTPSSIGNLRLFWMHSAHLNKKKIMLFLLGKNVKRIY